MMMMMMMMIIFHFKMCCFVLVEHYLRLEDKPLFGSLASRQSDCVSALVRLAAVSSHVSTTAVVKQHCVTLLAGELAQHHFSTVPIHYVAVLLFAPRALHLTSQCRQWRHSEMGTDWIGSP